MSSISIILCRPEGPANIGAVCRAMQTMNLSTLKLVSPMPHDIAEVKKWSLHAFSIYEQAQIFSSLQEASASCKLTLGVSRRQGKNRKFFALSPAEGAELACQYEQETAFVFGNEKNGLNDEELKLCHHAVSIPSSREFGSLNLSHAVQIVCYEIFKTAKKPMRFEAVSAERIETLAQSATEALDAIGFFTVSGIHGYQQTRSFLYNILGRSALHASEAKYVHEMFKRIRYLKRSDTIGNLNAAPSTIETH